MRTHSLRHEFVRAVPEELEPGVLYASVDYLTTSHLCACGCGEEVVLPLHPTKWRLTFDGQSVSMHPSVGSRALACRSHYWIDKGRVSWAKRMSDAEYERALRADLRADDAWHGRGAPTAAPAPAPTPTPTEPSRERPRAGLLFRVTARAKRLLGIDHA